ncbi:D-tagatose-bisphosphate aldolase, class II, non-catalytic subunit [Actinacidiphila acidipaludis]|uniref:D-tagatose-bisphosphate aldolase, class II, non-catalytic subunit n=1 Tax=Actinacidiphila acidipaludis TaxID=2873382 RepID=A0ABS7PZI1_9ACTN|nr:D-tagatose-bisphosphate aldolase, class II, non-catalytic subunit [Streptomyces acidipaludis]MBY8876153.1 D-tagatose-bisphosphate aldolase, class II, non-catalytic subunit [Streptomyces acidipaludis]
MGSWLDDVVQQQKAGRSQGITSVCSAHPLVIEAAVHQARDTGDHLLVEATSNQVDQYGGYTGMRPADFRDLVHGIAVDNGLQLDRVILGGDHLGPNRWQSQPPDEAMEKACALVAAYAAAGFTKIHLDCSFPCAGDPRPLTDDLVADRAARLIRAAEDAVGPEAAERIRYVIGTEVPTPGGAHEELHALAPTGAEAARTTLEQHRKAFAEHGIEGVWPRVMALVVQPAVEFDHLQVVDYRPEQTVALREVLDEEPAMIFEAHSTDYQTVEALTALVDDHWAVLKVGPGLTFALREALFALAAIEDELVPAAERSGLPEVVERRMLAEPGQWESYYPGSPAEQRLARRYSYSDRLRYYWPDPEIADAQARLFDNLAAVDIPLPLLSAHLPLQYARVRRGELAARPRDLAMDRVRDVLRDYSRACDPNHKESE